MLQYDAVVFDLDGTLTDSAQGIIACACYALEKMNKPIPCERILRKFIGPPLFDSFMRYCDMSEEEAKQAIIYYRERYMPIGWRENRVYEGIRPLLKALKKAGAHIYVATGKPQIASEKILDYFDLFQYIDRVAGPTDADPTADKKILIQRVLSDVNYQKAVMIGDRDSDIIGAQQAGIDAIGAGYGLGDPDEFKGLNCKIAASTEELSLLLLDEIPTERGYFLTIEGLDGCGKTTQANALEKMLHDFGFRVVRTREPGGCPIAEKIRDMLLDVANTGMHSVTEALLYAASRAQHVREVILPAVERGDIVLCDRFVDSSVAFQGGGRQLGVQLIQEINAPAVKACKPDATVLLKIDHQTALMRRGKTSVLDRIEREEDAFHARVEAAYDALLCQHPERFIVVDATKTPDQVTEDIMNAVIARLKAAGVM